VAAEVDAEVSRIIENARTRAVDVLKEHRKVLDAIAEKLVEVETIEREEFEKLLVANGIMPKQGEGVAIAG
jgi:cell division protease FtsH